MDVISTEFPDILLLKPRIFSDARGCFQECYSKASFDMAVGRAIDFIQDNHSISRSAGVLRGLHFQRAPHVQGKLVRVVRGRVLDVAVDLRRGSPTYGRHVAVDLSAENGLQMWVPPGFAHGFLTLEPETEVLYKVTAPYDPASEGGVIWNDPALGIRWPLQGAAPVLSDKDARLPRLEEIEPPFEYAP